MRVMRERSPRARWSVKSQNRTTSGDMSDKRSPDPRIVRTRNALGGALVALLHEKPLDAITVQAILDRARVSRSTFYAHYRDATDLFLSDAEDFLTGMASANVAPRVVPVRELFAHVADMHQLYEVLVQSGHVRDLLDIGRGCFARRFEREMSSAEAYTYAGALMSLMTWWLDHGARESPERMDELFHAMLRARPAP
jgi:AcrR family transcriptional regulator